MTFLKGSSSSRPGGESFDSGETLYLRIAVELVTVRLATVRLGTACGIVLRGSQGLVRSQGIPADGPVPPKVGNLNVTSDYFVGDTRSVDDDNSTYQSTNLTRD